MRLRAWLLPALLAAPLFLPVDGALACIRFKKPAGAIPPGMRDPKDPPPPPSDSPPPTTTPSDPTQPPPPTTNPSQPTGVGPQTTPRSGPTTPDEKAAKKAATDYSTWETWWVLNRIEFFPHRYVQQTISTEGPTPKGATPLSAEVVRNKLWKQLLVLKDDKQAFVREAALITIGRVASDEALRAEARKILVGALSDPNHLVARAAALGLFYVADDSCVWDMLRIVDDPKAETDVRAFTAVTLTALEKHDLIGSRLQRLVKVDKEADFELKCAAMMALGFVPGPDSKRFLAEVYADKREYREELRAMAIESFGRRGSFEDGREILTKALDDKEIHIRRSAAIALGILDYRTAAEREIASLMAPYDAMNNAKVPADVQAKVDELQKAKVEQRDAQHKHVRDVVKKLIHALQHDNDSFVASMAAIGLGRIAAQTDENLAIQTLVADLKKERNIVREYEILALAIAKAPQAYDLALEAATGKNRQPTTKGAGMVALGILRDPRAVEPLHKILDESDHPMLRGTAALALGMIGDERSAAPILTMLKTTKSPDCMSEGALGLALLGTKKGSDTLVKKLTETADGNVAAYTVYSLGLMKDRSKLDALLDIATNHGNFFVQSAGVAAIGYVSSAEDYPMRHLMSRGFNYMLNLQLLENYFYKL
jgi:HEAT repeat protein